MCSAVKVGPKVSFSKNVMALSRYSSGHVETNCPDMHSRKDFLPHKEYTSFSFAISAIGVH